jgi:Spy/CpxP family protein refolding chaperone
MSTKQALMIGAGVMAMALAAWPAGMAFTAEPESRNAADQAMEESGPIDEPVHHQIYDHGDGHESMYQHGMNRSGGGGATDPDAELSAWSLKKRLDLTDEQAAKLRALHTQTMKETILQGAKLKVAALELNDLLRNGKPNASDIEKKVKEIEALRSDLTLARTRALLKAGEFLKPEQFDRFRAIVLPRLESWAARSSQSWMAGEGRGGMRTAQRGERGNLEGKDCPSHARRPA